MKCHKCKHREKLTTEAPCNDCKYSPVAENDYYEEAQDKPVSAHEWWNNNPDCFGSGTRYKGFLVGFKAGEANNELRHRPQQTFDEWHDQFYPDSNARAKAERRIVWKACSAAHNLLEEND